MKKKLLLLALPFMFSFAFVTNKAPIAVRAEDETSIEVIDDSSVIETSSIVEEEEPIVEEEESTIKNLYETLIVPLLSGVSIASVLSALFTGVLALVNRKTIKLLKERNMSVNNVVAEVATDIQLLKEDYKDFALSIATFENSFKAQYEVFGDVIKSFDNLKMSAENLLKIKDSVYKLCEIYCEIVKTLPENIAKGVNEKLAKIEKEIREIK